MNCRDQVPNHVALHDIHISLVASKDTTPDAECSSVVAEMSPHHRPETWTRTNLEKVAKAKALVRVTGQLYFDSSHVPCLSGQHVRSNPKRASLWEVHPIYQFEVCAAGCDGDGQWLSLEDWVARNTLRAEKHD